MNVIIIQPPLVQLNTPYPSGAYLCSFFKHNGHNAKWYDLSNKLFYKIFSREGLTKLFSLSIPQAVQKAKEAQLSGDEETAYNLRRYVNTSSQWVNSIELITNILSAKESTRELNHKFVFGAFTPRGARMEKYLGELDHNLTTDDAFPLASLALADLADYITVCFDKEFSLIRYAENLTVSEESFESLEKNLDSPIIKHFYIPLLEELFLNSNSTDTSATENSPVLVCISVPFAGTFSAALATGAFFKKHFANRTFISMGGGFINTELRDTEEKGLAKYTDIFSYDRGYGSYNALFKSNFILSRDVSSLPKDGLYKNRIFLTNNISATDTHTSSKTTSSAADKISFQKENVTVIPPKENDSKEECFENEQTVNLIPDYSDIDFSIYPRMTDDTNPMHRLWNDGAWIKAYLAHGCYWHKCAFCDTTLDYVKAYRLTKVTSLYNGLLQQAQAKKVYGIHFVDEAAPPIALVQFANENIKNGNKLSFWGNIRFEKTFTRDVADFLAYGGLIGVSGGIEIATGNGLNAVNKGTDIDSIVASCCAFKEAGILVHAYMIYGYWSESEQDIIDSMETLRQLFENGLLDSSFWHKYVLTTHSTDYNLWKTNGSKLTNGSYSLKPQEISSSGVFSKDGLHFTGEQKSEKFGPGLNSALESWMHGEHLHTGVQKFFDFKVPAPTVPKDYIAKSIQKYEASRNAIFAKETPSAEQLLRDISSQTVPTVLSCNNESFWLAGNLYPLSDNKLSWNYMGEEYSAKKNAPASAYRGKGLCVLPKNLLPKNN